MNINKVILGFLLLALSGCIGSSGGSDTTNEKGKVKIVNSWGVGNWEKVPDGCFYATYEALKKGEVDLFFTAPKEKYSAKLMAVFKIKSSIRNGVTVKIGVENSTKYKVYKNEGGIWDFPDNNIAIDISEFLPLDKERVYIEVVGKTTGSITYFAVEEIDEMGNSVKKYNSDIVSKINFSTKSGISYSEAVTVVEDNSGNVISDVSRNMEESDILNYIENKKRYKILKEDGKNGSGYNGVSEERLRELIAENRIKIVDSKKVTRYMKRVEMAEKIDHTESSYFPPIGNQGSKGSCTTWTVGYYTATFYTARENNWDFSNIKTGELKEIPEEYRDKMASPEFLYNQANGGADNGSDIEYVMGIASGVGVCSMKSMPYTLTDYKTWPSESAWREAPKFRSSKENSFFYLKIKNDSDIEAMKTLLEKGYIFTIAINQKITSNMSSEDVVYSNQYISDDLDHAVTIAGYDDELEQIIE